jgi:hypothetical protein
VPIVVVESVTESICKNQFVTAWVVRLLSCAGNKISVWKNIDNVLGVCKISCNCGTLGSLIAIFFGGPALLDGIFVAGNQNQHEIREHPATRFNPMKISSSILFRGRIGPSGVGPDWPGGNILFPLYSMSNGFIY